jgi:hypothetical protein
LLDRVRAQPGSVVWWSNAFFTVHSNWLYTADEKALRYRRWVEGLAARDPRLLLYGSDCNNTSVNHITAGAYAERVLAGGPDDLAPVKLGGCEIRF